MTSSIGFSSVTGRSGTVNRNSLPPPSRLAAVGPRSLALVYEAGRRGPVMLNVLVPEEFDASAPTVVRGERLVFDSGALDEGRFRFLGRWEEADRSSDPHFTCFLEGRERCTNAA